MEDTKKLRYQLPALAVTVLFFLCLDGFIWQFAVKRCLPAASKGMQAKSVELADYLPFAEGTGAPRVETEFALDPDYPVPVLDSAAALYPVTAGIAASVYPEDSVHFDAETGDFSPDSALRMRNTPGAYRALVDGDADLILGAAPSKEQLAYAEEHGVELVLTPVGREAFVFLVNAENPVDGLTSEQVRGMFAGRIRNWAEVGGTNRPVSPVQRNAGSGSQTTMLSFMGDEKMVPDFHALFGGSIGYSFRFYVENLAAGNAEKGSGVKLLSLDGVYPDEAHVRDGSYPLVSDIYAVTRKDDHNPNTAALLAWLCSPDGQAVIEGGGYAALSLY